MRTKVLRAVYLMGVWALALLVDNIYIGLVLSALTTYVRA